MTSQRVERTWILTGGYGRFRGEWVNQECQCSHNYYIRRSIKYDSKTNEQEHYSSRDSQRKVEPRYNKPLHNEVLGKTNKFFFLLFNPVIVKDMKKNVDITKPRYSKQILPVPWVISRFHCRTATYQF